MKEDLIKIIDGVYFHGKETPKEIDQSKLPEGQLTCVEAMERLGSLISQAEKRGEERAIDKKVVGYLEEVRKELSRHADYLASKGKELIDKSPKNSEEGHAYYRKAGAFSYASECLDGMIMVESWKGKKHAKKLIDQRLKGTEKKR